MPTMVAARVHYSLLIPLEGPLSDYGRITMWFRRSRSTSGANRLQPPVELCALRGASPRPAWWWLTLPTGPPLWPSTSTPAVVDWQGLAFFKHYRQHADALPGDDGALESPRVQGPSWFVLLSVPF